MQADRLRGFIGLAIGGPISGALRTEIRKAPEADWEAHGNDHPAEIRECAELNFVPGEKSGNGDTQPPRYIVFR